MSPKHIAELKPWDLVHVDLIGTYSKSIQQNHPSGTIIKNNFSLTCTTMIDPATGWFKIFEIPMYGPDKVMGGNDEYIYKPFARVSQLFKITWLIIYPHPRKVVFDK